MSGFSSTKLNEFITNIIRKQGINNHQIESYNHFINNGIKEIIQELFQLSGTVELHNKFNDNVSKIQYIINFNNIQVFRPKHTLVKKYIITPSDARKRGTSYMLEIQFDVDIQFTVIFSDGKTDVIKKTIQDKTFEIPNMVRSEGCHLNGLNTPELIKMAEDPMDIGGYFIINGKEWVVNLAESKVFNYPHIYDTTGYENDITRMELISKPGDAYAHSSELIITVVKNGGILIMLGSHSYLKNIPIPFYLIYKLFNVLLDNTIINYIQSFTSSKIIKDTIYYLLINAFVADNQIFNKTKSIVEIDVLIKTMGECIGNPKHDPFPDNKMLGLIKKFELNLLNILDTLLLPHIGKTPEFRLKKIYYLSYLIYNIILVNQKINAQTDRDSLVNKRIHTTGHSLAKDLKSIFNLTIAQNVDRRIKEELIKTPYTSLPPLQVLLGPIFKTNKLSSTLNKTIVSGVKDIKVTANVIAQNKIQSERLYRKNNLNAIVAQRTIRTNATGAAKTSNRSYEMRRVHTTQIGYICPIQSPDTGESVGLLKQLSIATIISLSESSSEFIQFLLSDRDVVDLSMVNLLELDKYGFARIFVNGNIVAVTQYPQIIIERFREYRRGFDYDFNKNVYVHIKICKISPYITIQWDVFNNNIYFWLDHGRLLKPFLIVRNNMEHPSISSIYFKEKEFIQDIVLTESTFNMTLKELLANSIIEYIAPGELDNMLVAYDIKILYSNKRNTCLRYTHCDIPCANYGIPALTCPYANHNQAPRITLQSLQTKQMIGIPTLNPEHRIDKKMYYAERLQYPLVTTIANEIVYPHGFINTIVMLAAFGANQEDSLVINGTAAERALFKSIECSVIEIRLESNECCGFVEPITKINVNYEKLNNNIHVPKFTYIEKNDVLLAKYITNDKGDMINTSYIYKDSDPIVIEDIILTKSPEGYDQYNFKYYIVRKCSSGDKFSSRHGQKGSVSLVLSYHYLPFTEDCITPSIIMNTAAIPARMTIGQIIEGVVSKACILSGKFDDATIFESPNIEEKFKILESHGYNKFGIEQMYDGLYGHPYNNEMSITPITIQKLPKFSGLAQQATSTGPTSILTKQPIKGKSNDGGMRYGEMERDVSCASGVMFFTMEKLRDNSDGFNIYICKNCKKMCTVNEAKKIYICRFCEADNITPNIVKIYSTWMTKTFIQHLESSGIGVKFFTTPFKV